MNNKQLLDYIKNYDNKYDLLCETPEDYLEILSNCGEALYKETFDERRWWTETFCVVNLDGITIGYNNAETTGDRSPEDVGWAFDLDSICSVKRHEYTKIVISYTKIKEEVE